MKYLEINSNKGLFYRNGEGMVEINKMTKDDLYALVSAALHKDEFELTPYDEKQLQNPAHKTIYSHVYRQLEDIRQRKEEFNDEIQTVYKDAYEKYCSD